MNTKRRPTGHSRKNYKSINHTLVFAEGHIATEPCKASSSCYTWATHIASWDQTAGNGHGAGVSMRKVYRPMCLRHASKFAETFEIKMPVENNADAIHD